MKISTTTNDDERWWWGWFCVLARWLCDLLIYRTMSHSVRRAFKYVCTLTCDDLKVIYDVVRWSHVGRTTTVRCCKTLIIVEHPLKIWEIILNTITSCTESKKVPSSYVFLNVAYSWYRQQGEYIQKTHAHKHVYTCLSAYWRICVYNWCPNCHHLRAIRCDMFVYV